MTHYTGVVDDLFVPNVHQNKSHDEQVLAYATSKLALSTMQEILQQNGIIPNSIQMTCGWVDTNINVPLASRDLQMESQNKWSSRMLQYSPKNGALMVLASAFLEEEPKVGEFVMPYWFDFANSWHLQSNWFSKITKAKLNMAIEHYFQQLTTVRDHLWICPASRESRNATIQTHFQHRYLSGF